MIEVIKVIDLTDVTIHMKEILFAKVLKIDAMQKSEIFNIAKTFDEHGHVKVVDIGTDAILLECMLTEQKNNDLIRLLRTNYKKIEVVRGGAVAIESISTSNR